MIYTPKKIPKIIDFFGEKSEILGGFYLQQFFFWKFRRFLKKCFSGPNTAQYGF